MNYELIVIDLRARARGDRDRFGRNPTSDLMDAAADAIVTLAEAARKTTRRSTKDDIDA